MAKNASLLTLFAEDIREEKNGQISLIGVFDDELALPAFPTVIPKLAMLTTLTTRLDEPLDVATFRVFFRDGDTLVSHEMPTEVAAEQRKAICKAKETDPDREWISLRIRVEMHSVNIKQKGALCIEIKGRDGSVALSNTLKIIEKGEADRTPSISI